ncbi:MAG: PadR family transcriptional regulator [Ruminococcaceae bacterium]|nr:PadR family transcriptional regulator [Oscillospiraceae bacterium]
MPTVNTSALTEAAYYILLSLQTPLHGYAIMQNIKSITNGRISMGAGTLYGALNALNEKKYIVECKCDDPSRREYVITEEGKAVLKKEILRLEEMLQNAQTYFKED